MGKGPRIPAEMVRPEELVIVGIDADEPQFLYDERIHIPIADTFITNIMMLGVKKPIIVTSQKNHLFVVDGRQRTRAAREANKLLQQMGEPALRVPVIMQRGEEPLLMTIAVSTNEFHTEDGPLARARKAQKLRDRGMTTEEIAAAFGVSPRAVQNWAKYLDLSVPARAALESGEISASAAALLTEIPAEEHEKVLQKVCAKNGNGRRPTVRKMKAAIARVTGRKVSAKPSYRLMAAIEERGVEYGVPWAFIQGIQYAKGQLDPTEVKGLSELLESLPEKK